MRLNSLAFFIAAALASAGCGPTTPAKHSASSGSTTGHVAGTAGSTTTTAGASTGTTGTNATTGVHLTTSGSSGTHTTTAGSGSSGAGTTTGGTHSTTTSGTPGTTTSGTTSATTAANTSGTTGACNCAALSCGNIGEVCDPSSCQCVLPSVTTGGTTGSGTTGAGTTSAGTTGSNEVCGTKVGPDVSANCQCASGHTCSANNCYGGYWCDTSTNRCVAPPTNCSSTTTGGTTSGTTGSTTGSAGQLCSTCTQDSDCGTGGACALESANASVGYCALACTSSGGCADASATCADIFGDGSQYCYPSAGTCQGSGSTTGSTTGGGTGAECAPCSQDSDCGAGGTCIQESATEFYCAVACDSSGGCADANSTCFDISGGVNPTGCYPNTQTCSGFSGGTTGSTTGGSGTGQTCDVCTSSADCGSGLICVDDGNGGGVCAPTCDPNTSPRCPSSFTCYSIQSGGGACFPDTAGVCGGTTSATTGGTTSGTTTGGTTTGGTTTGGTTSGTTTGGSSGSSGTTGSCTPDTWTNYAQAFFANNCAQCHSFASSHSQVRSNAASIESRIQGGSMPPSGGLSQSDIDRITTWLQCGAP